MAASARSAISRPGRAFTFKMMEHHKGGIEMGRIIMQHSSDAEIKMMAETMIQEQEKDIRDLQSWLQRHGGPRPQGGVEAPADERRRPCRARCERQGSRRSCLRQCRGATAGWGLTLCCTSAASAMASPRIRFFQAGERPDVMVKLLPSVQSGSKP
jgi:hypothetical protein